MTNQIIMLDSVTNIQMNSFIITTEDGKIICVDGGFEKDIPNLLGWLKKLTGETVPHVDAWFMTHPHLDHITAFNKIMEHCPDAVSVDAVYYNFARSAYLHTEEPNEISNDEFERLLPTFLTKPVKMKTGDVYDFGAARVDVLFVPTVEYPHNVYNNTSAVFKLMLGGKSCIFLGDAGVEEGRDMLAMYQGTDVLKADYVQMAHHGQNGVEKDVYAAIAPTGCLWCTPKWLWDNDAGRGFNTHCFKTVIVRGWMEELGVKENYVMMNGVQTVTL